jgi:hypothetical protein
LASLEAEGFLFSCGNIRFQIPGLGFPFGMIYCWILMAFTLKQLGVTWDMF